ncbi:MAG: response regulator transcription factor [Stenotrophomonas acidaminiphila]|uniref:LytR/AlgR family response regulator transcription factor n=1 Tax=Stenotrophomonas acidaminiphila TaxID=128780 RepID=UPI000AF67ADD|nr:LytTR family DNA-binding domain-containing protein [Stenotrophomonas acidaminiphila]MBN8800424.1 response regulator transcription factor [Stenotrophomonas acidaminiphila]MDF9442025.1 response regulator transcription factor [Stenotrophomonas acidaminiphila]
MPLNAVILDDEPLARQRLRRLLGKVAGAGVQVVAECTDVDELMRLAQRTRVDVLFLDIELPGGDGFTALRRWNGPPPSVVFVSAYDQHGVRAFEDRAVDYLLKPVSAERLRETLSRLLPAYPPAGAPPPDAHRRRLPLQLGRRTVMVDEADIQAIRARGNYVDIETKRGTFTFRCALGEFIRELDADTFLRVHRSCVIRIAAAIEVITLGSGRYRLTLDCGRQVVTGRQYREHVQRNLIGRPFGSACP